MTAYDERVLANDQVRALSGPIVDARAVERVFAHGDEQVHALRGIDLAVRRGEIVAVAGRSGSGKTTLLNLLGGLDRPTGGTIHVDGREISALPERDLVELRRTTVAYVFQSFGLLPILSAAENVELPLRLLRTPGHERDRRVAELLERVGLAERARHRPHELSGGEQQRVAICRALAPRPKVLLADEPTGQLDSETGHTIMELLRGVVHEEGVTAVVATHDPLMIDIADRVIVLRDGEMVST